MRAMLHVALFLALSPTLAFARPPTEVEADAIESGLIGQGAEDPQGPFGIHFPFGEGHLDAVFRPTQAGTDEYYENTRGADSAIWTGHYLAAESFRYAVTRSDEAKRSVLLVFQAIEDLVDVTGQDLLARAIVPQGDSRAAGILDEEKGSGIWPATLRGQPVYYIGRTSRDQYAGVFFGLSVAYSEVDDDSLRARIASLVTRMIDKLQHSFWLVNLSTKGAVAKPNASFVTFLTNLDQIAAIEQVGKQVAPGHFDTLKMPDIFWLNMAFEGLNPYQSYYKFNLAYIHFFNLVRLEKSSFWRAQWMRAYSELRSVTQDHGNPHFNMIDRALTGPNATRDAETVQLLSDWLSRDDRNRSLGLPIRRDFTVDHRDDPAVSTCSTIFKDSGQPLVVACKPMPVLERINTDFLWQRSPQQLAAFGTGTIESSGLDYLLPYWMGRCYGVIPADDGAPGNTPCR